MKFSLTGKLIGLLVIISGFQNLVAQSSGDSEIQTKIQYLSGTGYGDTREWDFMVTGGRKSGEWSTISVPSNWEQEGFGNYQYGIKFYGQATHPAIADEKGKYKYEFEVPEEWRGRDINIVFDGVMTDAEVRVNGKGVGDKHQGAFYRFKYDISERLRYDSTNLLEVTVSKESSNESVNLAERRADYWNFGGIFRPVFLEALPAMNIERVAVDAKANGEFEGHVFLGRGTPDPLMVEARVEDMDGNLVGEPFMADVNTGGDKALLTAKIPDIKQWTAETPNLYKVKFTLKTEDGTVKHRVTEKFGFRTIKVKRGDGIYVNGKEITIKGINRHSFWPESGRTTNRELNYQDARLMKEMNMNAVRMAHYPPSPSFLEACDELGLYVMNELAGWHGNYDEGVGRKLVGEMVRRDVNHPSIIFWANGNEGGWNEALDDDFDIWDPQERPVLHPQQFNDGVETMHYRSYGQTQEYLRGEEIFLPTEFLHGLYDGGHGAGLYDYWEMMRKHPRCAGGYLWVFSDGGLVRTDKDGQIDTRGNYAPDGIVGPHREKEGSFFTVKEIWSPVYIGPEELPGNFDGTLEVENRYDFTNLNQCSFDWSLAEFYTPSESETGHRNIDQGTIDGPNVAPDESGNINLNLPNDWKDADVLYVAARNPEGDTVWTRSYNLVDKAHELQATGNNAAVNTSQEGEKLTVNAGDYTYQFDKETGDLVNVKKGDHSLSFGDGPRFIAARRGDRNIDGAVEPKAPDGVDRVYKRIEQPREVTGFDVNKDGEGVTVKVDYFGPLTSATWNILPSGLIQLDYEYRYDGVVELMGVKFDYPESKMKSIRWLGEGPYRVWQNRVRGTQLDIWENEYNDLIPGETFDYPSFKGYFNNWHWAVFETEEGKIMMSSGNPGSNYLGVYRPRDGRDNLLYTLPKSGLAVFDVIPGARNKVNATDLVGPSSKAQRVSGPQKHSVYLRFDIP